MTTALSTDVRGALSPFSVRAIPPRRWWEFFTREGVAEARQEIENLLAGTTPDRVSRPAVAKVIQKRRVSSTGAARLLQSLYSQAVTAFLAKLPEPEAGRQYMTDLRDILSIGEDAKTSVNELLVVPQLAAELRLWVESVLIGNEIRGEFDAMVRVFDVPHDVVARIQADVTGPVLEKESDALLASPSISPQSVEALFALAAKLRSTVDWGDATKHKVRAGLQLWALENGGDLPVVDVGSMQLQRDEVCHFCEAAEWLEARTVRMSAGNVGYTYRLGSGFTYRTPRVQLASAHHEVLTPIESGFLYITDKRVIFTGRQRNATLKIGSLLGFTQYSDGIQVQKTSGRNPVFTLAAHAHVAGLVLGRVFDSAHDGA